MHILYTFKKPLKTLSKKNLLKRKAKTNYHLRKSSKKKKKLILIERTYHVRAV